MSTTALNCYVFKAQTERLALPSDRVSEILRAPRISRWPNSPPALVGLTSLRGRPIPVFSLQAWLSPGGHVGESQGRFVILDGCGSEQAGLVVDTLPQSVAGALAAELPGGDALADPLKNFLAYSVTTNEGCFHVLDYPALFRALGQGQTVQRAN